MRVPPQAQGNRSVVEVIALFKAIQCGCRLKLKEIAASSRVNAVLATMLNIVRLKLKEIAASSRKSGKHGHRQCAGRLNLKEIAASSSDAACGTYSTVCTASSSRKSQRRRGGNGLTQFAVR